MLGFCVRVQYLYLCWVFVLMLGLCLMLGHFF